MAGVADDADDDDDVVAVVVVETVISEAHLLPLPSPSLLSVRPQLPVR